MRELIISEIKAIIEKGDNDWSVFPKPLEEMSNTMLLEVYHFVRDSNLTKRRN